MYGNAFVQPEFAITRQDSLGKEMYSRNEVQKEIHVVSKNLPFVIHVGSDSINLHNARLYAKLFYDSDIDTNFKEVDHVKQEPMTYKCFVNLSGDSATLEFRVFVLTSQHEDSLFRVKIGVYSLQGVPLELFSEPFKVVSKPSLVGKERRGKRSAATAVIQPTSPVSSPSSSPNEAPVSSVSGTKRNADQMLVETLQRLEDEQRQQRRIIEQLLTANKNIKPAQMPDVEDSSFEVAFQQFLNAYAKVPFTERASKLRKVMSDATSSSAVTDLIATCCSQENALPVKFPEAPCNGECQHKKQLEALDSLYTELTWSPESDVF